MTDQFEWTVVGKPGEKPQVGQVYDVSHQRKGRFQAKVLGLCGEWATVLIVDGKAKAAHDYNVRYTGEEVTVRNTLATFTPVPKLDDVTGLG